MRKVPFRYSTLAIAIAGLLGSYMAYGSVVRSDIPYQDFRDFAENKGKFSVGATDIPIYNTSGNRIGSTMVNAPMPDFSALANDGRATLVSAQFVSGVAHNTHSSMSFGTKSKLPNFEYKIVARNNLSEPITNTTDFHAPRLHKLVTETAPIPIHYAGELQSTYEDANRFSAYARAGSGLQYKGTGAESNQKTYVAWAYKFLTGGNIPNFSSSKGNGTINFERKLSTANGIMPTIIEQGDSGSPLLAYDRNTQRWGMIGATRAYSSDEFWYVTMKPDFITQNINNSHAGTLTNTQEGSLFTWSPKGNSSIINGNGKSLTVLLKNTIGDEASALNHGKSVRFDGQAGTITLANHINQGAGALELGGNMTVKGANANTTWLGAGVVVDYDKTVNWQVKNPVGDRLSKLGQGTLVVNGTGTNSGDISVGDGKVVLAMNADSNGNKQAFNRVEIVSGRPTVVLNDSQQVKPENIHFGYRGGRVDLNGTTFDSSTINAVDDGAKVVNHNTSNTANVVLRGHGEINQRILNETSRQTQAEQLGASLTWGKWGTSGGDIYEYINTHAGNRTDYFILNAAGNAGSFFPTNQTSNNHWTYLGSDKTAAIETAFTQKQSERFTWGKWGVAGSDIYEYINTHAGNRKDYFVLKDGGNARRYFPTQQTDNDSWIYLGSDKFTAIKNALKYYDTKALIWGRWSSAGADIYEYINNHAGNRTDYFVLKGNAGAFYPTNQTSSDDWEYLGSDKQKAIDIVVSRKQAVRSTTLFTGVIGETNGTNGRMNMTYKPTNAQDRLVLTGGMRLNGELKVNDGTVLLSGRPVPHAYDYVANREVVNDDEWINREYRANAFSVNHDGKLIFGRNVSLISGSFYGAQQGLLQFGFIQGSTPVCERSDHTGDIRCSTPTISENVYNSIPTLQANGNVRLWHNANLHLGKSHLIGRITADKTTTTTLESDAKWLMSGDSSLGNLVLNSGEVDLNAADNHSRYQTLTINGDLSGTGRFSYLTNAAEGLGDHITVNGRARGNFNLAISNTGREPTSVSPISLMRVTNAAQNASELNLSLNDGYVDLGAYRYILANVGNDYRLYSPLRDVQVEHQSQYTQLLLDKAKAEAEKYAKEVKRLSNEAKVKQNAQRKIQNSLDTLKLQYKNQESYLESLKLVNFIARKRATQQLNIIKNQIKKNTALYDQLDLAIRALDISLRKAQVRQDQAQTELQEAEALIRQAEALCRQTQSTEICEAVVRTASFDDPMSQKDGISKYTNAALSELSAQVSTLLQVDRNVYRELTKFKTDPLSVWVNYDYQQVRADSANYRRYKRNASLTQLGVEGELSPLFRAGVMLSSLNSSLTFDQAQGDGKYKAATAYLKAQSENGWIAALDASYGKAKNSVSIDGEKTDVKRHINTLGVTIAKLWQLNDWQIRPSVGVKQHRLSGVNYHLNGAEVQIKPMTLTHYQAGLALEHKFQVGQLSITPRLSSTYTDASHNSIRNKMIGVNGNTFMQNFDRHFNHELGLNVDGKNWFLDANLGILYGKEISKYRYAGIKVGYRW